MADDCRRIAGLRFNELGVEVTDAEIQATWTHAVEAERAWNLDQLTKRCPHGVNLDAAGCGSCVEQEILDETMGVHLAARFEKRGRA